MSLKYYLRREYKQAKHPFVLIGGIAFLLLGIISRWIGGNPRQTLIYLTGAGGAAWIYFFFALWGISMFLNGAVFGAMYTVSDRCDALIATRSALLVVLMHVFALFAYPLFFACYAWLLALVLLLVACVTCVVAIFLVRRISFLSTVVLIVHFALLLWAVIRVASIIFMN